MNKEFMNQAISMAKLAAQRGDVPVGAVLVKDGEIVGKGLNRREAEGDPTAHAEIEAIRQGAQKLGGWHLEDCELYVTLEPCPMCAGAIVNARIPTVVFGASDDKCGACGSVCDLFSMDFNHHPQVVKGVCQEEAAALLTDFFKDLREKLKDRPKWKKNP
ncbi:MAG: tRNA adenosine(34) deaminase TadA [Acutalibacteraceae bacterium]|nr:tRNA adenosine(34) deaminase TadA [Acutalibacteraceae bacterium]